MAVLAHSRGGRDRRASRGRSPCRRTRICASRRTASSWCAAGSAATARRSISAKPTVSRAAVRLASGEVGFGYTLGRDGEKARMIALCDALVQSAAISARSVERDVIAPLRGSHDRGAQPQGGGEPRRRGSISTRMVRGEG